MATQSIPHLSEDEYLAIERAAGVRSEFIDGEMFPMPGGSLRHSCAVANWTAVLARNLQQANCFVLQSDMRVRTAVSGSYLYPDVSVVPGTPEIYGGSSDILTNPRVIVEVLSPSTADYDHGKKFELYREINGFCRIHPDAHRIGSRRAICPAAGCKLDYARIF